MNKIARMRVTVAVTICFLLLAPLIIVNSGCDRRSASLTVKVGYIPFNNCLPFFAALEKGYFANRGLNVEPVRFNDSTEALNALLGGQVDSLAGITFSSY